MCAVSLSRNRKELTHEYAGDVCARRGGIGTADLCQSLAWRRKMSVKNVRIRVASGTKMCYNLV